MKIYDRKNNILEIENQYKENTLKFLYNNVLGRILLNLIFARPWFNKLISIYHKSSFSKKDIIPFIKKYKINTINDTKNQFSNFNDFFIRKKYIKYIVNEKDLISVADSKLLAYPIVDDLKLKIKGSDYSLEEILNNKQEAKFYKNGYCLIFRLTMDDNHRYIFPDFGKYLKQYHIKGTLHTIRPISSKYKAFKRNSRTISILECRELGRVAQIEVGAMLVGHIVNHNLLTFNKLQEKGYFEYGGSTIILLLKNNIKIDEDILYNTKNEIETKVEMGEKIGEILC